MKTPLDKVSQTNLPAGTRHLASFAVFPALLFGLSFLPIPAAGQGISQGAPQSQVTAAASKVPRSPNAGWGMSGSENQGSTQPRVAFEDGQLSISANDSSLADVLYALRACTGADIDIPSGASAERVTAQLGPGPARKVLSDLLTWSSFDYVIQGSDSDPLSIQSVTLMVRVKSTPSTVPSGSGPMGARTPIPARPVMTAEPVVAPAADVPEAENRTDAPNSNPNPNTNPTADNAGAAPPTAPGAQPAKALDMSPSSGSSAGKSPADMIQELQQMYQQRRMLQEQQNRGMAPAPATPQ